MAFETAEGDHDVLAKGFPTEPLRLTFRGRRELPVNVENIAVVCCRERRLEGDRSLYALVGMTGEVDVTYGAGVMIR